MAAATHEQLKVVQGFLGKADGKDKLCATVQYALMFAAAGEPGRLKKAQASVALARKVFRLGKPLEMMTAVTAPSKPGEPQVLDALGRMKGLLLANYFLFDHFVWAHNAGLTADKSGLKKLQKISLWSWFGGSVVGAVLQAVSLVRLSSKTARKLKAESDKEAKREAKALAEAQARKHIFVFLQSVVQATLAAGLLQTLPLSTRTCGALGVTNSLMGCYLAFPGTFPAPKAKAKAA